MANRTIIRTRYTPKSALERSQTFSLVGTIKKISEHGIQVTRRDSKARFWVGTDFFIERTKLTIADNFEEGQEVKMSLVFNCFPGKNDEFIVKPHLADISPIDMIDAYGHEVQNPHFLVKVKIDKIVKTQFSGLFVLSGNRVNEDGFEFERYIFRHYAKDAGEPELGVYEVAFNLQQSSKIINTNGEIFFDEEEYTVVGNGEPTVKRTSVYVPALDTVYITPVVSQ